MGLKDKLLETERDSKLIKLYTALTRSDFKGNYEDTYVVECLFALVCLDIHLHEKNSMDYDAKTMMLLAKELVRICEVDGGLDIYSFYNWSNALCEYMKASGCSPNQIHKMNTFDLRKYVSVYLEREE